MAYRSRVACSEPTRPEIFCWVLAGPQVAVGLAGGGRDAQAGGEPEHVVLPVAQAFEQVAAGPLLAAGPLGTWDRSASTPWRKS
jgi:hypothetical protein